MKIGQLKNLAFSNTLLIIISLLLGYTFWYISSYDHYITIQIDVPLCFSHSKDFYITDAPEKITITLLGKRSDLYDIDRESLAAHIDMRKLLPGKNGIILTKEHFFLPQHINVLQYKPMNLSVTITTKEKQ